MTRRRPALAALGLALAACAPGRSTAPAPAPAPASAPTAPAVPGSIDLGAVMRRVHFAFRPEEDGYGGGHSTYAVAADARGRIAFTPRSGHPLALETTSVTRGATRLAAGPARPRPGADGCLVLDRARETLCNGEAGLEQSWRFAHAPAGKGDLVVRLRVSGLRYAGETPGGLHFADPSGVGVRYSSGTWVDAPSASQTEVIPEINIFDPSIYMPAAQ